MQQHIFPFVSKLEELQNTPPLTPSSHCSLVQERLVNYRSEALDTVEHLGLILKDQDKALTQLNHFGSVANPARASVQDLSAFLSRNKPVWNEISYDLLGRITEIQTADGDQTLQFYDEVTRPSSASGSPGETERRSAIPSTTARINKIGVSMLATEANRAREKVSPMPIEALS